MSLKFIDNLFQELRRAGHGCHIGGIWVGAAGYADDLVLIAPSRSAMQSMLNVCETYAESHNLQYSTNPVPTMSKSKCLFMCGSLEKVYPKPLTLFGRSLPWVEHGTHLGHEFHQSCSMDMDITKKRADFIETAVQIKETFSFARPEDILHAVSVYAGHWYGAMLWDLYGEKCAQLYRSWSTCVKLTFEVPRSTHTYLVENVLAKDFLTVKQQLVGRFTKFFERLRKSISPEVQVVANILGRCARSITGSNLKRIQQETGLDPWLAPHWKIRSKIVKSPTKQEDAFRAQYLRKLLEARFHAKEECQNTEELTSLINSLCSS